MVEHAQSAVLMSNINPGVPKIVACINSVYDFPFQQTIHFILAQYNPVEKVLVIYSFLFLLLQLEFRFSRTSSGVIRTKGDSSVTMNLLCIPSMNRQSEIGCCMCLAYCYRLYL